MKPHLGWIHELQLHEMHLLVVRRIMDPLQLVDLIEPAIHIRVPTLQIERNKFGPCRPFAVQLLGIGATSSHGTLRNSSCQNFHISPAMPKNTRRPQGLPYLLLNPLYDGSLLLLRHTLDGMYHPRAEEPRTLDSR